jgi:hypothetical protein
MKFVTACLLASFPYFSSAQPDAARDSIEVRVLNKGRHYLKKHVITIDKKDYVFADIWKGKYSAYKKIPYIWSINNSLTTVIVNRMIKYDSWLTVGHMPIDYIGERKYTAGKYRIEIRTKRKKGQLEVEQEIIKE